LLLIFPRSVRMPDSPAQGADVIAGSGVCRWSASLHVGAANFWSKMFDRLASTGDLATGSLSPKLLSPHMAEAAITRSSVARHRRTYSRISMAPTDAHVTLRFAGSGFWPRDVMVCDIQDQQGGGGAARPLMPNGREDRCAMEASI